MYRNTWKKIGHLKTMNWNRQTNCIVQFRTEDVNFKMGLFWEKKCVQSLIPACVYAAIRKEFAFSTGLYTHFKFSK